MRKISDTMGEAFLKGEVKRMGNTMTDGSALYLFDNKIAEWRGDELWITSSGWMTRTTMDRLNGIGSLINFGIYQRKKAWYLNGVWWDGNWARVETNHPRPEFDADKAGKVWIRSKSWKSIDGMRGYYEPTYAVCGANDTGMWDGSPCPSLVAEAELNAAKQLLSSAGIPTKLMTCESSNVFCVHHYLIARPIDKQKAHELIGEHLQNTKTELLYPCD